ncbi:hypothetical protein BDN72DRAFT_615133 [Pluteus cervinus]|uniref:Uncharacterized protein n=1 Tax=Pluteus cervinus TaxID=181527 RepID=A0ACD3AV32_9AGAR|nr:hypothetical protein BDN72DRAFT_615133 [Pluteus cervinus]
MGATSSKRKNGVNPYPLALGAPAAGMPPGFQPQGTLMQAPHFLAGAQNPYQPAYPNQIFTSTYQPGFRRKRNRQKREIQGVQPIFGFVPPGFQPQAMPPVVPAQMPIPQPPPPPPIAPSSSGAPPPLFTPGNGAQLRGFPSPFPDGGQGDTSGTSRRPQTPFLPPLDGRYEAQDDSNLITLATLRAIEDTEPPHLISSDQLHKSKSRHAYDLK